jgi:hypothetical protein
MKGLLAAVTVGVCSIVAIAAIEPAAGQTTPPKSSSTASKSSQPATKSTPTVTVQSSGVVKAAPTPARATPATVSPPSSRTQTSTPLVIQKSPALSPVMQQPTKSLFTVPPNTKTTLSQPAPVSPSTSPAQKPASAPLVTRPSTQPSPSSSPVLQPQRTQTTTPQTIQQQTPRPSSTAGSVRSTPAAPPQATSLPAQTPASLQPAWKAPAAAPLATQSQKMQTTTPQIVHSAPVSKPSPTTAARQSPTGPTITLQQTGPSPVAASSQTQATTPSVNQPAAHQRPASAATPPPLITSPSASVVPAWRVPATTQTSTASTLQRAALQTTGYASGQRIAEPVLQTANPQATQRQPNQTTYSSQAPVPSSGLSSSAPPGAVVPPWRSTSTTVQTSTPHTVSAAPNPKLDAAQVAIGTAGMAPPPVGPAADGLNAAISASRGRLGDAAVDAASAVPLAGDVLGAGKTAARAARLTSDVLPSGVVARPTWQQSEAHVASMLGQGTRKQVSYLNGQEVPGGTKGSVKPDAVTGGGIAVEVKNYDIAANRQGLIYEVTSQAIERVGHLPANMRQQVYIDVRGQNVSLAERIELSNQIAGQTLGVIQPGDVKFIDR